MVNAIDIQPQGAANAGCSATSTLADSYSDTNLWWKLWEFQAFAAQGWVFDHWEMSYSYQDTVVGGASGNFTQSSTSNPWSSGAYSQQGTEEWDDASWQSYSGYQHGWRTITALTAVFRLVHVPTNLILRSPTNGQILRGAAGTILRDA